MSGRRKKEMDQSGEEMGDSKGRIVFEKKTFSVREWPDQTEEIFVLFCLSLSFFFNFLFSSEESHALTNCVREWKTLFLLSEKEVSFLLSPSSFFSPFKGVICFFSFTQQKRPFKGNVMSKSSPEKKRRKMPQFQKHPRKKRVQLPYKKGEKEQKYMVERVRRIVSVYNTRLEDFFPLFFAVPF